MNRARASRSAFAVPAVVAVLALSACPARRAGLPRESLEAAWSETANDGLPTLADVLRLRVPAPAAAPASLRGAASAQAFARGEAIPVHDDGVDAAALRCLRADLVRDYAALVDACIGFALAHPSDARAVVALVLVTRHLGSLAEPDRRAVFERTSSLVASCAAERGSGSCAELAVVVDQARRAAADALGDDHALRALRPGADITTATAEGPFFDADESFAGSPFSGRPLARHGRYGVRELSADDGVLVPSRHSLHGWWRLTLRGEAKRGGSGLLVVRAGGPLEVRLDGAPVIVRPHGALVADSERVGVHLAPGMHVIEVMSWEAGRGVRVSVVDDDGAPLLAPVPRQRWERPAPSSVTATAGVAEALALPPSIDRGDVDVLPTLMFRHAFARAGLGATADDERALARVLIDRFGWSAPALVAAAQTIEDDALPERVAGALAAPLWQRVLETWPTHPVALVQLARAAREERPEEAIGRYRALVQANPTYPIGRRELIAMLLDRGVVDEARDNANALLAAGETPENIDAAVPALRAAGETRRAAALLDVRARRSQGDHGWRRRLVAGETTAVRAELSQRVAEDPDDAAGLLEPWLDLVEVDDPRAALRALDAAAARFPDDIALQLRRARLLARVHGEGAAIAALERIPTADVRVMLLRTALGAPPPWAEHLALGDDILARRQAAAAAFPGFPTVFLLDDVERDFAADGSSYVLRHWIAQLRTKDALDAFGELRVHDDETLLRLRVVKPDGRIFEAERNAGVDDVSLPALAPGDVVEWLSFGDAAAARDGAFWETRSLVRASPALLRRLTFVVPRTLLEARRVRIIAENGAAAPETSTTTTFGLPGTPPAERFVFAAADAAPLLDEPGSVDDLEIEPQGGIAIDVDDDIFRRRRGRDLASDARVDPWLVDAARLIAGRGTDSERLQRLFRFVAREVTPADAPADAISVLVVGRGRRHALFHALAAAAGLDARAVGVHPPLALERRIPHAGAFPLLATRIVTDGEPHLVSFADPAAIFDRFSRSVAGAETIDLTDGTRGVVDDQHIDPAPVEVLVDLALEPAGTALRGVVAVRLPAVPADLSRAGLRQLTEDRLAQVVEGAFAESFPGIEVGKVTLPGLNTAARPLGIIADVEIPLPPERTVRFEHLFRGGAAAALGLSAPLPDLVSVAERQRPLRVVPDVERLELRLRLPADASLVEVPPSTTLRAGPVELVQTSAVEDGALRFERTITREAARVSASSWPAVRAALAPLLAQVDARIAFVRASPAPR